MTITEFKNWLISDAKYTPAASSGYNASFFDTQLTPLPPTITVAPIDPSFTTFAAKNWKWHMFTINGEL
jgi:hypothetical protein